MSSEPARARRPRPGIESREPGVFRPIRGVAHANGWWGMVVLIATEGALFGTLIYTYLYLRFHTLHWPPPGVPAPQLTVPILLTALVVSSSVPMQLAWMAARRGALRGAWLFLVAALAIQVAYLALQVHEYAADLDRFSPQGTAYGSIYFTLLAVHHLHVLAGIALDVWLALRLLGGVTTYRLVGLQGAALYWHFVNVLAIIVTGLVLSPSL